MTKNPVKWVLLAGALALAAILALYFDNTTIPLGEKPRQFEDLGGHFKLASLNGDIDLEQYRGKVVVMYFGFLNCAEVCPSSVGVMSAAMQQVDQQYYNDIQGFFVSVDPKRDDLESLHQFAQHFDPRILGLTGTEEEIDELTKNYGVYYDMVDLESSELSYTVDHVSRFYILDETGDLIDSMSHSTTPIELAARLERAVNGR